MMTYSYGFNLRQLIKNQTYCMKKIGLFFPDILFQDNTEIKPLDIIEILPNGIRLSDYRFNEHKNTRDYSRLEYPIQSTIPIVFDKPIKNEVFGPYKKCKISNEILAQVNRMPILSQKNLSKRVIFWINQAIGMDNFNSLKWQEYPIVFWLLKKLANIRNGKNNAENGKKTGEKTLRKNSQTHFSRSFFDDLDTVFEAIQLANTRLLARQQKNPNKLMTMFLLLSSLYSILSRNKTYSKNMFLYSEIQRIALKKRVNNGELFISDWLANFKPCTKDENRWIKIFKLCRKIGKKPASIELDLTVSTINKHLKAIPNSIKVLYENSIKEKTFKPDWVFIVDNILANPIQSLTPKVTPRVTLTPRVTPKVTPKVTLKGGTNQTLTPLNLG